MSGSKELGPDRVSAGQRLKEIFLGVTPRDRRNGWRYAGWAFLWMLSMMAVTLVLKRTGLSGPVAWAMTVVPIVLSFVVLRAYLRFLREADELTRRIQFEAIAFGFGVGVLVHFAWFPLEQLGVPELDRPGVMVIMVLAYLVGMGIASRRYK